MTRPVDYLRSRSLPLLALVEAARIVFGRGRIPKVKTVRRESLQKTQQLRLEGIR